MFDSSVCNRILTDLIMGMSKLFINKTLCGSLEQIKINNNLIKLNFMKLKNFNRLLFFAFILLFVTQSKAPMA